MKKIHEGASLALKEIYDDENPFSFRLKSRDISACTLHLKSTESAAVVFRDSNFIFNS